METGEWYSKSHVQIGQKLINQYQYQFIEQSEHFLHFQLHQNLILSSRRQSEIFYDLVLLSILIIF